MKTNPETQKTGYKKLKKEKSSQPVFYCRTNRELSNFIAIFAIENSISIQDIFNIFSYELKTCEEFKANFIGIIKKYHGD